MAIDLLREVAGNALDTQSQCFIGCFWSIDRVNAQAQSGILHTLSTGSIEGAVAGAESISVGCVVLEFQRRWHGSGQLLQWNFRGQLRKAFVGGCIET